MVRQPTVSSKNPPGPSGPFAPTPGVDGGRLLAGSGVFYSPGGQREGGSAADDLSELLIAALQPLRDSAEFAQAQGQGTLSPSPSSRCARLFRTASCCTRG